MALDFPSSPALNQTYTDSGKTWSWNGSGWQLVTSGTVTNADISATAEIAVSKLADGSARQLLQTDAAGTGVEWTSNVDIPGTLDVTGVTTLDSTLSFPLGSVGSPSIYPGTDTNTGFWSPAADTLAVSTGGSERLRVANDGKVGIAISSAGASLEVYGDAIFGGVVSPTKRASFDTSGKLSFRFDDNSVADCIKLQNLAAAATTNHGAQIRWQFGTNVSASPIDAGNIYVIKEQDWTSTISTQDSAMLFYTALDGSVNERVRITSAGNLGVATSSPAEKIHAIGKIKAEAAATQDAVILAGRAGGTSSYAVTITPTTLAGNRTLTLADGNTTLAAGTMVATGAATTSGLTMATSRLLGRTTASTGAIEELTVGNGLSLSGGTLSASTEIAFTIPGNLTTGAAAIRWYFTGNVTVTNVVATVSTAPTGASVIFDVNKNGTTIFSTQANRPTITATNFTDLTSSPDVTTFASGDYVTIDVDQIGSTVAGADAVIRLVVS